MECVPLDAPEGGEVVVTGVTVGSTATYSCLKDRMLVGVRSRTCQEDGQWSGEAPICRRT